jgi:hypothetical protein
MSIPRHGKANLTRPAVVNLFYVTADRAVKSGLAQLQRPSPVDLSGVRDQAPTGIAAAALSSYFRDKNSTFT